MSADGKKLRAVDGVGNPEGLIYTSTNFGTTWEAINSPRGVWQTIASSADGTKLIAAAWKNTAFWSGPIYTSVDAGLTWVSNNLPVKSWRSVACSADGSTFIAVTERSDISSTDLGNGSIWISKTAPEPRLNLASSSNRITLSWMTTSTNFGLQQILDLSTNHWTDVTNAPVLNLTNLHTEVFLPTPAGNTFYRLETR